MRRVVLAAAAALMLAGCETATPYQPLTPNHADAGGYSEQQIEPNRWQITFAGNSLTSRERVERYLLFRAAQLTTNQGFDWFQAVDRHTNRQTSLVGGDPDPYFAGWDGPYWGFYRPSFGWGYGYYGDPFWGGPLDVEQVTRYTATVEVVMGHGAKPNNPRAYDARAVIAHLQGSIKYPESKR
jgi:hypothetical protein